ncbi:metal-dependent hydrolase [Motiliproteus sp. MSK22-1]|uniref:metal-dependent hydrolase n=1 Tax=Motiliproteus sp. MSK22-1 TaxID=1897630 RepID=UPI0009784B1A|nr:metal-dependent hydrolase [Motiliproteus sp. MSK22-1]OMH28074.1 hypothetical protein BGP75_22165 [Motiliproteus sp. MSK22-1]
MPNGVAHQLAGVCTGIGVCLLDKKSEASPVINPVTSAMIGGICGKLPDLLEPAIHPNHRQFFHSVALLGTMTYSLKRIYDWEPETDLKKVLRSVLIIGGTAYVGHLVLDSLTKKSLPTIGKL